MKIGILGGTFNPIHLGHLVLAKECRAKFGLNKVIFVPAGTPPHKTVEGGVSVADRLNMVRLALEGEDGFEVSTYEIDKGGVSYSIDTIKHFKEKYGADTELFFLTGSDSTESLSSWKDIDEILDLVTFVIGARPGWEPGDAYKGRVRHIVIPRVDVSSSMVRERIKSREPIDHLVPVSVVKYIRNRGLYGE